MEQLDKINGNNHPRTRGQSEVSMPGLVRHAYPHGRILTAGKAGKNHLSRCERGEGYTQVSLRRGDGTRKVHHLGCGPEPVSRVHFHRSLRPFVFCKTNQLKNQVSGAGDNQP